MKVVAKANAAGPQAGFTLIEMSIALVIIALVAGGVVAGRTLLSVAESRRYISQMESLQAGVNSFKLKFGCVPGDCRKATSFGVGLNGNGDGLVESRYGTHTSTWPICLLGPVEGQQSCVADVPSVSASSSSRSVGEHQLLWAHLSGAGFLKQNIVSNSKFAGVDQIMDTVYPRDAAGRFYLHAATWNNRLYVRSGLETVDSTWGGQATRATERFRRQRCITS